MSNGEMYPAWQCPGCGEANAQINTFCKKCGYNPHASAAATQGSSGRLFKILIIILVLAIIGAASFFGYKYWQTKNEEKVARAYLQTEQKIFSDSVLAINRISSETNLIDKYNDEKNLDLVVEKIKEERSKAEETGSSIEKLKNESGQIKTNTRVEGLNYLLAGYFSEAERLSKKYASYIAFAHEDVKIAANLKKEWEQFEAKFKYEPASIPEMVAYLKALKVVYDSMITQYDTLVVPEGMDGYKNFMIDLRNISQNIGDFIAAIEKNDLKKMMELGETFSDLREAMDKSTENGDEIVKNYYSQMHDEFSTLRSKADKIKGEITLSGTALGVQLLDYSIEGW